MTHQNLNEVLNDIADEQLIEPGSWQWLQGGPAPFSGATGEHASYGWNHVHRTANPEWVKAVIANYGHRRTYYASSPTRKFGYYAGGRPTDWSPELEGDQANGTVVYTTSRGPITVSGPEVEHFWLNPLWALIDTPPMMLETPFGKLPSDRVAHVIATLQVRSMLGQIRYTPSTIYPWGYGDRANSRIVDTIMQASKRGCLEPADVRAANDFIDTVFLPFYEQTPGISINGRVSKPGYPGAVICFNGLYWLLPVVYDAWRLQPGGDRKDRLWKLVTRWSQWALDLELTVPGRGFNMSSFFVDLAKFYAGGPHPSIGGLLSEENINFDLTWEIWSYRACAVAAEVTKSPVLEAARDKLLELHGTRSKNLVWLVDPEREPEFPERLLAQAFGQDDAERAEVMAEPAKKVAESDG